MKFNWFPIVEDTGGYIGCIMWLGRKFYYHKKRPYEWEK